MLKATPLDGASSPVTLSEAKGPGLKHRALLPVYAPMPVRPVRGHGAWLVDEDGLEWLDAYGGHAVASTGHSHPDVVRAIADQAAELLFYSTAVPLPQREALAEKLAELCPEPLGRVFFCNSGAEANENALHLARRYTERQTIVTVRGGWHGRTAATLACTDGPRYEQAARRAGVPLSEGAVRRRRRARRGDRRYRGGGAGGAGAGLRRRAGLLRRVSRGGPTTRRRARCRAAVRRGAVRRRTLRRVQRGGGVRRDA